MTTASTTLYQSTTVGILGGGQLGRMLIQSAVDYNLTVHILDPAADAPCSQIAHQFTQGSLKDFDTVYAFGQACDVLTIEIESVNTAALRKLQEEGKKVFPEPDIIELIQDKRTQKQFYADQGIPTADFVLCDNAADVASHKDRLPAVNKLGKEGYDGQGVQVLRSEADLAKAFDKPGLLEDLVDFEKEISVIVARNASGEVKTFPVVEMVFHPEANLVEYLFSPAEISAEHAAKADQIARDVIEKLQMTGLLAVEMFLTKSGDILVNEVAPRPHNSGHQTIEANRCSQYEQHLRAILDLPLGATDAYLPAAMVNLLGEEGFTGPARYKGLREAIQMPGVHVHLYGKSTTKPFRKMGHVTITAQEGEDLKHKAETVKQLIQVIS